MKIDWEKIKTRTGQYYLQNAIAFDQQINAMLGGSSGETLSAVCWRRRNEEKFFKIAYIFINSLFFFQTNHCKSAFENLKARTHLPKEYK